MCGIAGCLALAPSAGPDTRWVEEAAKRIAHRGPDDDGTYSDFDVALGFKRLAIIDLSPGGHQPMCTADRRYWMVYNGEIYNYIELAQELRAEGVRLRTSSDSEVLLETYARSGREMVSKLRGMYAFAIWDTHRRELFCARDPFGIKPFFYRFDGGMLKFASEKKALAEPGELTRLDGDAVRRYLAFQYVPAPATLTPPVRMLPPGHVLTARPGVRPDPGAVPAAPGSSDGSVEVARFWGAELRPAAAARPGTPGRILQVMRDSVDVHLRSDAPLGAFLSGGIDSAAICALVAERRPDLLTFTVGFEREGYSEIDRAQETAAALGVKSMPYVIGVEEFMRHLPQIVWHLDDPMADAAAVPLWFVAREARRHVKVVLSGEGSDELFGGYLIYHQPGVVRAGEKLPGWGRSSLQRAAALIPAGVKGKGLLERTSTPLRRRFIGNAHVFTGDQIDLIAGSGADGNASPYDVTDPVYALAQRWGLDDVATMQLVDINTWLAGDILVKADRMTMAHGLELRVPFLDSAVLAVAAQLAKEEKTGGGTTKYALREAMSELLPRSAVQRAKLGFPVPVGHWLKGQMHEFAHRLLSEAQTGEWVNRAAALDLLSRYRSGEPDANWRQLWVLIVFSLWHQIYVERVYDPVALGWAAA
ncbi:MAG TPA: asparagine synthase (glutamine-hydrolyzing) [Streptosporangiaceae bacterium]|nr:asparagine synthase (glutamine-hydrolyzing) [Streptosporangiaceae bacterium]